MPQQERLLGSVLPLCEGTKGGRGRDVSRARLHDWLANPLPLQKEARRLQWDHPLPAAVMSNPLLASACLCLPLLASACLCLPLQCVTTLCLPGAARPPPARSRTAESGDSAERMEGGMEDMVTMLSHDAN